MIGILPFSQRPHPRPKPRVGGKTPRFVWEGAEGTGHPGNEEARLAYLLWAPQR